MENDGTRGPVMTHLTRIENNAYHGMKDEKARVYQISDILDLQQYCKYKSRIAGILSWPWYYTSIQFSFSWQNLGKTSSKIPLSYIQYSLHAYIYSIDAIGQKHFRFTLSYLKIYYIHHYY